MRMTTKQIAILNSLIDRNADGSALDLDQLLERLETTHRWVTTKPSLQFSLRCLIEYGLVMKEEREIRRGRKRAVLSVTDLGKKVMGRTDPVPAPAKCL